MQILFEQYKRILHETDTSFKRYLFSEIDWSNRLIAITGARGTGKTTLLLQHIKEDLPTDETTLYASLDNIYFSENNLFDFADEFVKSGGKVLLLDEVHKYANWSVELKNIYDSFKKLKIIFTGSSVLEIEKSKADLSRRAVIYQLNGLSLREFINIEKSKKYNSVTLDELLTKHTQIAGDISSAIKPLPLFKQYLQYGFYPYYLENKNLYHQKLRQTINLIIETDLPAAQQIDFTSVQKLKKLLYILSQTFPFKPNISKLAKRVETTRPTLLLYLHYLERALLISQLKDKTKGLGLMSKAEKIYPGNPNIMYALVEDKPDIGTMRETFFLNHLLLNHTATSNDKGDFMVDKKLLFEIGGKTKNAIQIAGIKNSFLALDDIEIGFKNKIPLWLFGFLY
ncbi:MAG: AAA family ATPase [Bacteroidota bacterium]